MPCRERPRQDGRGLLHAAARRHGRQYPHQAGARQPPHDAAAAHEQPPRRLPDLRSERPLQAAGVCPPLPCGRASLRAQHLLHRARGSLVAEHRARPEQVHPLRSVRAHLRRDPEHRRGRFQRPRQEGAHLRRLRQDPQGYRLCRLRPVRRRVPDGRDHDPQRDRKVLVDAAGSDPQGRRAVRTERARRHGRALRPARKRALHRQARRRAAPPRRRRGV